ncbi:YraN family protein [Limnochorda pilosa]|uniref:UPF0102 protein LIP_1635 n=1 Tax=Limnochorda pilosa TaxID=1555112 RepID=A0A0K2SK37_LIMPI|nr:YraN family protein [Limnochorda pilosa]BAS27481.1 hypothetical protein LIP_1635 [Limnochorda pilosa]
MPGDRRSLGAWGERLAQVYLEGLGYRILERNLRSRLGELDLVALDGQTLAFVEVRTRRSSRLGGPEESVDGAKRARLARLAAAYLQRFPSHRGRPVRIDVVTVRIRPDGAELGHLRNVTG